MNISDKIKILTVFVFLFSIMGCTNSEDCCTIIDTDVRIHYQTESGENLLDSSDAYSSSNIRIYFKNGEQYEYVYNSDLAYPNNHSVYENEAGDLLLRVFTSYYYEGNRSTTLIELNENTVDTLVCEYDLGENKEIITKGWLNGVELENQFISAVKE